MQILKGDWILLLDVTTTSFSIIIHLSPLKVQWFINDMQQGFTEYFGEFQVTVWRAKFYTILSKTRVLLNENQCFYQT